MVSVRLQTLINLIVIKMSYKATVAQRTDDAANSAVGFVKNVFTGKVMSQVDSGKL